MTGMPRTNLVMEPTSADSLGEGALGVLEQMAGRLNDLEARSRQLAADYQHLDEQFRLAGQIQQAMLPDSATALGSVRVHAIYRPLDRISGDIYDIVRLDETRVGVSLADAAGHGLPAALLTVFIKRLLRGKEIVNGSYRIVPSNEILRRLNRELRETRLAQCPYVTAMHAVYDETSRRLTIARGGMPYPVLMPACGPPRELRSEGGLIGAFDAADFQALHVPLKPGDRVAFFSDGLTALLNGHGTAPLPWLAQRAEESLEQIVGAIENLAAQTPAAAWHGDDITLIAIRIQN